MRGLVVDRWGGARFMVHRPFFLASGGQGALFEKTAPWTPVKAFIKK